MDSVNTVKNADICLRLQEEYVYFDYNYAFGKGYVEVNLYLKLVSK